MTSSKFLMFLFPFLQLGHGVRFGLYNYHVLRDINYYLDHQGRSQPFFPFKPGPRCKAKIAYINFCWSFILGTGYTSFAADDQ